MLGLDDNVLGTSVQRLLRGAKLRLHGFTTTVHTFPFFIFRIELTQYNVDLHFLSCAFWRYQSF